MTHNAQIKINIIFALKFKCGHVLTSACSEESERIFSAEDAIEPRLGEFSGVLPSFASLELLLFYFKKCSKNKALFFFKIHI